MKRFVASKEDVKELRDKGIIINQLESDEQVVQLYKDLNTYGADNNFAFRVFWDHMESHFNSNAKMWIADFKTKYFDNPWTTIALAGSIFFLFMDIVQTYFAAVPPASTK
ncbi:hypothetical protein H5410_015951 [Solanum commersonii]|uniref:Uncharacterized protein n=1 Tax=Solanum commersonii TaxID=4109 RepID=A0A9J5ZW42_SOLCO|nr:hypothetical protein H5410_015951 [Solanum commersonii]